jgi:hypothetical protein
MKRVAIVGTNGIPAEYGGFETLAENLVGGLREEFAFNVYCSRRPQSERRSTYHGARLIYLPISANGWNAPIYDAISIVHALFSSDIILVLGPSFSLLFPFTHWLGLRTIVNFGGLNEWCRPKYNYFQQLYLLASYFIAARFAYRVVADNYVLRKSIRDTFSVDASVIRYGGDQVQIPKAVSIALQKRFVFLAERYYINVSRAQVDNNIHILIDAFLNLPEYTLVVISNWQVSEYGRNLRLRFSGVPNIHLIDAIYDRPVLDLIRSRCHAYIHSHSYCGTAPSLVEAICLGLPLFCFDVATNRETTRGKALYFTNSSDLVDLVRSAGDNKLDALRSIFIEMGTTEYKWRDICNQYADLFREK